jgi:hypothetical protein
MGEPEVTLFERRAYLFFCVALGVLFGLVCAFSLVTEIPDGLSVQALISGALLVACALAVNRYWHRIRNPRPIATLTPQGVTDEYGTIHPWSDLSRIYWSLGVLFIVDSKCGWVVRLDRTELGGRQVFEAIEFIKAHAPNHLYEKL